MAREHLYKAKRKDNGEWIYGLPQQEIERVVDNEWQLCWVMQTIIDSTSDDYQYAVIDENTICEYIGLKDKNGKQVFEGDIVKLYLYSEVIVGDIRYSENDCRFKFYDDFLYPYGFDNTTPIEVIGNKFDNPELLEVQDEL